MNGSMEATVMKYFTASNDAYADLVQAAYLNFRSLSRSCWGGLDS